MLEQTPRRLAVATLLDAGDGAAPFRGPDGRPLSGYGLITGEGQDCRITVYLEYGQSHTAVLAGDLVWLEAVPGPAEAGAPQAAEARAPEPWADLLAGAGGPAMATASAREGGASLPEREPEPEREPLPAEPQPLPGVEPDVVGFKLYPEPATPVSAIPADAAPTAPVSVPLTNRHPLAPRANGTALLDLLEGRLTLTLRGLPSPAALGRDPATDRPCNAYRAWLLNQRAGTRQPLGLLSRVWGENFRLESEPELPLSRHDAILITAEDRSAPAPTPSAPQVLFGAYQ